MDLSREFGLAPQIIEKDYVLGWLLAGISNHPVLREGLVFKGGTCLKKCYFETYRFSEDLDFTVIPPLGMNEERLLNFFKEIVDWIYGETGIEIPEERIRVDVFPNPRGMLSAEGRIYYRGPLMPRGDIPRIKLDLTEDEILVMDPVYREVHHPYSDRPETGIHVQCYCFAEVFAEKIRALTERLRPRDLYDVIHLYRHSDSGGGRDAVQETLEKKCSFKGIQVPTAENLLTRPERAELKSEWENLAHQLPTLPPLDLFWQELTVVFDWLNMTEERQILESAPNLGQHIDKSWRPPSMAVPWGHQAPLEEIRFAAANHLCVGLDYQGSTRLIEPYSMRRTSAGNLLLYAVKHKTGEIRSYRVDRIQGASATNVPFSPRYVVELTPGGNISIPPAT